jgi:hypothetical protein
VADVDRHDFIGTLAEAFRRQCLEKMEGKAGENHLGQNRLEAAQAKAHRRVTEELLSESDVELSRNELDGR